MSGGDLCSLLWQERFGSFHRSAAVGVLGGGGEGSKPGDEHLVNWFASLVLSLVSLGSKHLGPLSGWSSSSAWTVRAPSCFLISSKDSKGNRPVVQLRYTSWLQAYLLSRSKDFLVKLWGRITVARLRWAGSISTPPPTPHPASPPGTEITKCKRNTPFLFGPSLQLLQGREI